MVKLTDKCLNNAIESPITAAMWLPADIKSNILKAQAEAGHKVNTQLVRTVVFSDVLFSSVAWCWRRCLADKGAPTAKVQGTVRRPFSLSSQ